MAYWRSYQTGTRNIAYKAWQDSKDAFEMWTRRVWLLCPNSLPMPPAELLGSDMMVRAVLRDV
jgi:hypothetical protein